MVQCPSGLKVYGVCASGCVMYQSDVIDPFSSFGLNHCDYSKLFYLTEAILSPKNQLFRSCEK